MRFGVLGPLLADTETADTDGGAVVEVTEPKVRLLLAALLVYPGRPVSVDRLVDLLWPAGPPRTAGNALQSKVSQLRRALGDRSLVLHGSGGYRLDAGRCHRDADEFDEAIRHASRTRDTDRRLACLDAALGLWRGDAFEEWDDPWFAGERTRLDELRVVATEDWLEARIAAEDPRTLVAELSELVARHPLRPRIRVLHMRALAASGLRAEALASFRAHRDALADATGLDPDPSLVALHESLLRDQVATPHPGRIPAPVTPLVGRERAVQTAVTALRDGRLVTLTGIGGVGKTRLAVEVAHTLATNRTLAVCFVELEQLAPPSDRHPSERVAEAVLAALGVTDHPSMPPLPTATPVPAVDRLDAALTNREILLVLDNCEHVVDPTGVLTARLLRAHPALRVLATSRQPLALAGERILPVDPLELPQPGDDPAGSPAVRLFVDRVASTLPEFSLHPRNSDSIAQICRRLDGIPLALELVAPRVRVLGVPGLLDRLDDRLQPAATLTDLPPRQRTLHSMIDWSFSLLTAAERAVLRRLAVFAGGFTAAAARSVCSAPDVPEDAVTDLLARLVDRSLVVADVHRDGPARYRLLATVAEFCAAHLEAENELDRVTSRHSRYFTALAERAAPELEGPEQARLLAVLDEEYANLRAVAERPGNPESLRMVEALRWYWVLRGRYTEACRLLRSVVATTADDPARQTGTELWHNGFEILAGTSSPPLPGDLDDVGSVSGRTLWFLAFAAYAVVAMDTARAFVDRAIPALESAGDRWGLAAALCVRAQLRLGSDEADGGRSDAETSMAVFTDLGDAWGRAQAAYPLAILAEAAGDYPEAMRLHQQGYRGARELGLWHPASDRLCGMARIALLEHDVERSLALHRDALAVADEHGYEGGRVSATIGLGLTLRRMHRLDEAEEPLRVMLDWGLSRDFLPVTTLMYAELGFAAELRGDTGAAHDLHRRGLEAARRLGDVRAIALAHEGLAGVELADGHAVAAARLLGEAHALRLSVGLPLPPGERGDVARIESGARAMLGDEEFTTRFTAEVE